MIANAMRPGTWWVDALICKHKHFFQLLIFHVKKKLYILWNFLFVCLHPQWTVVLCWMCSLRNSTTPLLLGLIQSWSSSLYYDGPLSQLCSDVSSLLPCPQNLDPSTPFLPADNHKQKALWPCCVWFQASAMFTVERLCYLYLACDGLFYYVVLLCYWIFVFLSRMILKLRLLYIKK